MKFLINLRLGVKLPLILVTTVLVALGVMGYVAYKDARKLLQIEGTLRLSEVLEARARELEVWSDTIVADVTTAARSAQAGRMLREMGSGWRSLGADAPQYVVDAYITKNPNPPGQRQKLDFAGDISNYSMTHRRYHPGFVAELEQKGYYDVFLIDIGGNVIYTVAKESDFGANVKTGPLSTSGLGQAFAQAIVSPDGAPVVTDFAPYAPSADAPAAFIAAPVVSETGTILGVLAYQLPIGRIDEVLSRTRGLGETGQGYVVGSDKVAISDLRLAPQPTTLAMTIDTKAVSAALAGTSGAMEDKGALGADSVVAYGTVQLFGHTKAVVVEQSSRELFAGAAKLTEALALHASWLTVSLALIAYFVARSVARPLTRVGEAMGRIAQREFETIVPYTDRKDEVGDIAAALDRFCMDLALADSIAQDATLKGAAFMSGSSAMMMADTEFNIIYTNPSMLKLMEDKAEDFVAQGLTVDPRQLIGKSMDIFHSHPERVRAALSDSANLPMHANLAIGEGRYTLDISEVTMPDRGRIGYVVEWRDVSEVQMNRAILQAIDANQATAEISPEGKFTGANENFLRTLNCELRDLVGRSAEQVLGLETETGPEILLRLRAKSSVGGLFRAEVHSGHVTRMQGAITPVIDRTGVVRKMVMIASDVTEAQREIKRAEQARLEMQAAQERVVDALRGGLTQLSRGDLRARIDQPFEGEYEQLRSDFNAATETLASAMQSVIENATEIESEAREISNAAEDLSRRTEQQAATLEETAAALDELTSSVHSSAEGANETNRVVNAARASAQSSGNVVKQAVSAMGEIEQSSSQISKIISVIDDIAFQTNLLALNAGVEAARAGEAGRGFAVVASEVRALAQRSSEAAREIDALISASSSHVRRGVSLVGEAGQALEGILDSVNDISARVSEIAASSQEQSAGIAEINVAVNQLDQVTQQNAAMFEEATAASHALTQGAQSLNAAMAQFTTEGGATIAKTAPAPQAPARRDPAQKVAAGGGRRFAFVASPSGAEADWEDF